MTPRYNLIILHVPPHQHVSDFVAIREMMAARAPEIDVSIITLEGDIPATVRAKAAERPSIIFSPFAVPIPNEISGARFAAVWLSKFAETTLLRRAGAPVPETRIITPRWLPHEEEWGSYIVVKPVASRQGQGVRMMRTKDVRWIDTSALPRDDPRHRQRLLAQRFIDTGPRVKSYRVLTVLGRPVYCALSTALAERPKLDSSPGGEVEIAANAVARTLTLSDEPDVIALATSIHANLPRLPAMAIDIIRESDSGRLFALEFNSGGYSWNLSSDFGRNQQRQYNVDFYGQFNALDVIADALIDATRTNAA